MNTNIRLAPRVAAVMGALIADSAALGLHWIYDADRIAQIEKTKGLAFLPPQAEHYANVKGYFVHGGKEAGASSAYGEICLLILKHLAEYGEFKRTEYQTAFRNHFGPGGNYTGYIDTPTRQILLKLIPLKPEEFPEISGVDDDQFAALATVPVITAAHKGSRDALLEKVEQVVRLTHNNHDAIAAAKYTASVLLAVLEGSSLNEALTSSLQFAGETLTPLLSDALNTNRLDSVAAAQRFGSACHVLEGLPVIVHILRHATGYQQAVEANIRASGDNCGRAIMLGAIAAAAAETRNDSNAAIPLSWLATYKNLATAAHACTHL